MSLIANKRNKKNKNNNNIRWATVDHLCPLNLFQSGHANVCLRFCMAFFLLIFVFCFVYFECDDESKHYLLLFPPPATLVSFRVAAYHAGARRPPQSNRHTGMCLLFFEIDKNETFIIRTRTKQYACALYTSIQPSSFGNRLCVCARVGMCAYLCVWHFDNTRVRHNFVLSKTLTHSATRRQTTTKRVFDFGVRDQPTQELNTKKIKEKSETTHSLSVYLANCCDSFGWR